MHKVRKLNNLKATTTMKTYKVPVTGVQATFMVTMLCASDSISSITPDLNYSPEGPDPTLFGD